MHSFGFTPSLLKSLAGRLTLCLVVLAMIYRGAIPLGYMLAPSSASPGKLMVTLCVTGGGMISVPMDAAGAGDDSDADGLSALECPFAPVAAQYVLPQALSLAATRLLLSPSATFVAYRPAPALPPVGPPLGSRAPPADLA